MYSQKTKTNNKSTPSNKKSYCETGEKRAWLQFEKQQLSLKKNSCFDFTKKIVELQPLKKTFKIIQITNAGQSHKKKE